DPVQPDPVKPESAQGTAVLAAPEPGAAVRPAPSVPRLPAPPAPPLQPAAPVEADKPPVAEPPRPSVPQPAPRKARTIRVEAPSRPSLWHLTDLSGQVWEDPDPDRLRHWVAYRNASLTAARPRPLSRVRKVILSHHHF